LPIVGRLGSFWTVMVTGELFTRSLIWVNVALGASGANVMLATGTSATGVGLALDRILTLPPPAREVAGRAGVTGGLTLAARAGVFATGSAATGAAFLAAAVCVATGVVLALAADLAAGFATALTTGLTAGLTV